MNASTPKYAHVNVYVCLFVEHRLTIRKGTIQNKATTNANTMSEQMQSSQEMILLKI